MAKAKQVCNACYLPLRPYLNCPFKRLLYTLSSQPSHLLLPNLMPYFGFLFMLHRKNLLPMISGVVPHSFFSALSLLSWQSNINCINHICVMSHHSRVTNVISHIHPVWAPLCCTSHLIPRPYNDMFTRCMRPQWAVPAFEEPQRSPPCSLLFLRC